MPNRKFRTPLRTLKKPGVFISEINASPHAVAPVATAIPAFIGYTPQTPGNGKSLLNQPVRISSLKEFESIYGPNTRYEPHYYLLENHGPKLPQSQLTIGGKTYILRPDPNTVYYLYNSLKLFFENGGQTAYIVSVGSYGRPSGRPTATGLEFVNRNVTLRALQTGLIALKRETEPSIYVFPDANLLSSSENAVLIDEALAQNEQLENAFSIIDVAEGRQPNEQIPENDIDRFRIRTKSRGLRNGAAYYPFLRSSIVDLDSIDYTNLFGGDVAQLVQFLISPKGATAEVLQEILNPAEPTTSTHEIHEKLLQTSDTYKKIIELALAEANCLPPSGAIAGIYAAHDRNRGVWKAPANIEIAGVSDLTIQIDNNAQQHLNIDPTLGKSVNAIRSLPGRGVRIWGARTLDGNNPQWRYIPVRRTLVFVEQSCQRAIRALTSEPNTQLTWKLIETMIETFLESIWRQGGFAGATSSQAYGVKCGLGSTMTTNDILNGDLKVQVYVSLTRPAEFTVFTITQKMSNSPSP